jgi:ABC-type multidrug transport system permease subunit
MQFELSQLKSFLNSWRVLLEWEFLRTLNRGWQVFARLIVLGILLVLIVLLEDVIGENYFSVLLPGLATIFLLHPFLYCGSQLSSRFELPFAWRSTPVNLMFFVYAGVVPEFLVSFIGFIIFFIILAILGVVPLFFTAPLYWIIFLALIPGAIGWGLILHAIELMAETDGSVAFAGRRLIELLGVVFILPAWLPTWIYPLHYLFPHSYLAQFGRGVWLSESFAPLYYSAGVAIGFVLLAAGMTIFSLVLDITVQRGGFDRYEW